MISLRELVPLSLFTITACLGSVGCDGVETGGTTGGYGGAAAGSTGTGSTTTTGSVGQGSSTGSGVAGSTSSGGVVSISFSESVQPILTNSCVFGECHSKALPKSGLSLSEGEAIAHLVNVEAVQCDPGRKLVEPGNPENSYLIDKLKGQNLCFGVRMPFGEGPMPAADLKKIVDWITAGAPDN